MELTVAQGGWGIYTDQTSNGVTFTNNIVHSTEGSCYEDHEGYNMTFVNNILDLDSTHATRGAGPVGSLRSADPTTMPDGTHWRAGFNLTRNIVFSSHSTAALFAAEQSRNPPVSQWALSHFDRNVYWRPNATGDARLFPDNQNLTEWQSAGVRGGHLGGQDKGSVVADPLFKDATTHDYALADLSPALTLGFIQINQSLIGPRSAAERYWVKPQ